MTEPKAPRKPATKSRTRRPTKPVEIPGQDETKEPGAPLDAVIEQDAINQAPANVTLQGDGSDEGDITDVVAEAGKAGQLHVYQRREPQIGDEWAGMTLTEDGWVNTEAWKEYQAKDK